MIDTAYLGIACVNGRSLLIVIALLTSNPLIAEDAALEAPASAAGPALHAVRSERVRQIMVRMNALLYERMYTALELDRERARQLAALADTAAELAGTADAIPEALSDLDLPVEERTTFQALANQLYTRALELQGLAAANRYHALDAAIERLNETCNACHSLFRNPIPKAYEP